MKNMSAANNNRKSMRTAGIISASVIAVLAVSFVAYFSTGSYLGTQGIGDSKSSAPTSQQATDSNNSANLRKGPPPMTLTAWGTRIESFEQAKASMGVDSASLPSEIPLELRLDSARVQTAGSTKLMTVFYTPEGSTASDTETFEGIMSRGGLVIVYSVESLSQEFDRDDWIKAFVSEEPNVRRIETINGMQALVNTGNPDQGITYQVLFWKGDLQINLVSLKYTETELMEIAKTMT